MAWLHASDLGAHDEARKRKIRAIAKASRGEIISGQHGYRLTREAAHGEYWRARDWLLSQAKEMHLHVAEIDHVWHNRPERRGAYETENQVEYYRFLFARAQEHRFEFIVSFIHRDYDTLWEAIKDSAPEIFKAWRDCGFLDETGKARPALALWDEWFARPWQR